MSDLLVDNPAPITETTPPVAAPSVAENNPPADPGTSYDPTTATRADRIASIIQKMNAGADVNRQNEPNSTITAPSVEPPAEPPAPDPSIPATPTVEVPDKFKNADGSVNIEALVKSYQFAERKISEQGQQASTEVAELRQAVLNLQNTLIQRGAGPVPGQNTPPAEPPKPSPEELAKANEEWLEKFYDNPQAALQEVVASTIKASLTPMLEPVLEREAFNREVSEYSKQVAKLAAEHDDVDQYRAGMEEILKSASKEMLSLPNVMEVAYFMAKGRTPAPAPVTPPAPAIEDLLKDPEFLEKIKAAPEVKNGVLGGLKTQIEGEPKPPVVGARPGGATPSITPVEIRTTKDAARASAEFFRKAFAGTP